MKKLLLLGTVLVQVHLPAQPTPKPIPTAPEPKDEGQIILLQGVELETVLDLYSTLTGKTILAAQNLPKVIFDLKTLNPLTNDETIHFLESALEQREISIIPQGDKILMVIPSAETVKSAMAPIEVKRGELPDTLGYVVVKVKIKNVLPHQMIDILTPFCEKPNPVIALDDSVLLRDRTLNVKRMMEVIEDIDIKPVTFKEKIPVKNRTSGEICQLMNRLTSSLNSPWSASMAFLPLNEAKAVLVIAPFKSDLTRAKSIINKLDQSKNSNPTQP